MIAHEICRRAHALDIIHKKQIIIHDTHAHDTHPHAHTHTHTHDTQKKHVRETGVLS